MFPCSVLKFRSSFRFKLFCIFTIMTALVIMIFCVAYITVVSLNERKQAALASRLLGERLAGSIRIYLYAETLDTLQRYAAETAREPDILAVVISNTRGQVLAEVRKPSDSADVISQTVEVHTSPFAPSAEDAITGETIDSSGNLLGTVRIDRSTRTLVKKRNHAIAAVCGIALVFWAVVSALSYLAMRRITSSFTQLAKGVQAIHSREYVGPLPVMDDDESGQVAQAINDLAQSLRVQESKNLELNQALSTALALEVESKAHVLNANRLLEEEVAERKKAEQSVRESQQALTNLMDHMPVGVAWTSPGGTINYLNLFFVERFGYSRREISTIDDWFCRAFPDPMYRAEIVESRRAALTAIGNAAEPITIEARITCRDGAERHVLISNQIAHNRIVDLIIDLTDRELLQEQFIKVQKLESLGVLAGGIAHNFNNVLTGVMGYISFARKFLDKSHSSYPLLENAEKASKRAAGIARQLLTFAQGGTPDRKPISVARLVYESVGLVIMGTCVRSRIEIPDTLHAVKADEGLLSQAFNSIIINAVQAMPSGGLLTIQGSNFSLAPGNVLNLPPGDYIEISFEDEGGGIVEEHHQKIFVPYFTTKAEVGTGLGLATAHSIITRHGGTITFKSQQGIGTTFTIHLPSAGIVLPPMMEPDCSCNIDEADETFVTL